VTYAIHRLHGAQHLNAAYYRVIERRGAVAMAHHFREAKGLSRSSTSPTACDTRR
jgi:hypothetical protein